MSENQTRDWIHGSLSERWGPWKKEWPADLLKGVQEWGDSHGCRFLLTAEQDGDHYSLVLYCAPKPNRSYVDEHSISTRDKALPTFTPWFEGFLAGKGITSL